MEVISQRYDVFFKKENNDNCLIYFPLSHYIMEGDSRLVNKLKIILNLSNIDPIIEKINRKQKLIIDSSEVMEEIRKKEDKDYLPTHIFLFPTLNCNLKCLYCYSHGGREKTDMEWVVAKAAVSLSVSNALKRNKKEIKIYFHGGGEPTLNWNLITQTVAYAKKETHRNDLMVTFGLATNGLLSKRKADFIMENGFEIVSVALDGPPEIQNMQRPGRNKVDSFAKVYKTCKYFDNCGFKNYDITVTVTNKNLQLLVDIVHFLGSSFNTRDIHLGPMVYAGRGCDSLLHPPDFKKAPMFFQETLKEARKHDLPLDVSIPGTDIHSTRYSYCGASGSNCFITYDGLVSTCLEAYDYDHPRGKNFIIGRYDGNTHSFQVDSKEVQHLRQCKNIRLGHCSNCFIKWNCAGDCMARVREGNIITSSTDEERCHFKRTIAFYKLRHLSKISSTPQRGSSELINRDLKKLLPGIKRIVQIKREKKIFGQTISICPGG